MYGNLGLGDTADRHRLTQVGGTRDWAAVSAGVGYALALKKDGSLWAWGDNNFGQLGVGDTTSDGARRRWAANRLGGGILPRPPQRGAEAGRHASGCGVRTATASSAWATPPTGPARRRSDTSRDWAAIAPGGADSYHSLALRRDGTLWAWGLNRFGQLGLGDTTDRLTPRQVRAPR